MNNDVYKKMYATAFFQKLGLTREIFESSHTSVRSIQSALDHIDHAPEKYKESFKKIMEETRENWSRNFKIAFLEDKLRREINES